MLVGRSDYWLDQDTLHTLLVVLLSVYKCTCSRASTNLLFSIVYMYLPLSCFYASAHPIDGAGLEALFLVCLPVHSCC